MHSYRALQLASLWSVFNAGRKNKAKDDPTYELERCLRWYSKTFSTPYADVEKLPIDHIIKFWWIEHYEEMSNQGDDKDPNRGKYLLLQEIRKLTESPEDLKKRQLREDEEEALIYQDMLEIEKEEKLGPKPIETFGTRKDIPMTQILTSSPGVPLPKSYEKPMKIEFKNDDWDIDEDLDSLSFTPLK